MKKVRKITVVLEFDESVDYEEKYELSEAIKEVADMIQDGYVRGYEHGNISNWETEYEYEEDDDISDEQEELTLDIMMSENQVLQSIANKFKEEMPSKRLLSITLDGFSHSLFYDDGTSESEVKQIFYSGYTPEVEMSELANILFKGVPHSQYQGNPQEFTPIAPEDR